MLDIAVGLGYLAGMLTFLSAILLSTVGLPFPGGEDSVPVVTYSRHIAPIIQQHCQGCHRPGEIAPMSLLTFDEVKPWARAIRKAIKTGEMPPWNADPQFGKFKNDVSLRKEEVALILNWIDSGAPEGDRKDLPKPRKFIKGWNIGVPDAVFSMQEEYEVPAKGTVPYKYFVVPTEFKEDRWVTAAEVRPGAKEVVHHVIIFISEPGSKGGRTSISFTNLLCGTAPGEGPDVFPPGSAKLIKAGSKLIFQCHYTPNGKKSRDRSRVGFKFAKGPVRKVYTRTALNSWFRIPPRDGNHKVTSKYVFRQDSWLFSLMAHMHLRGKSFRYDLYLPGGEKRTLLNIPSWDFNWQTHYQLAKPISIPAGSRVECTAYFDNSARNKANPDPDSTVRWGDQTWEEMMIGYLNYVRQDEEPVQPPEIEAQK